MIRFVTGLPVFALWFIVERKALFLPAPLLHVRMADSQRSNQHEDRFQNLLRATHIIIIEHVGCFQSNAAPEMSATAVAGMLCIPPDHPPHHRGRDHMASTQTWARGSRLRTGGNA